MTQDTALEILKTGVNVFLTGEPGSGKTHTVNRYVAYLKERGVKVAITASTGIAATHIGGVTIHSWSGIGIRKELSPSDISNINKYAAKKIKNVAVLIIDEISMLNSNTLGLVDLVMKAARHSEASFGGMQVVFVGDFFQLPPVSRVGDSPSQFAFVSAAWQGAEPSVCYLSEQHRQSDSVFLELLTAIRSGDVSEDHCKHLDSRLAKSDSAEVKNLTTLFPHNVDVDHINSLELKKIPGEATVFAMESHGNDGLVEQLKRGCLSPEKLELKKGAAVMFTKNNFEMGFVNGTLGTVTGFDGSDGYPVIRTRSGKDIHISPMEWVIEDDGRKAMGEIRQLPVRLAWAMTVHKSQGITLDSAFMDLRGAFVEGQGYVALSRVRSLDGLYLAGYNAKSLMVHQDIIDQDQIFRGLSAQAESGYQKLTEEQITKLHQNFMFSSGGLITLGEKSDSEISDAEDMILDKTKAYSVEATARKPSSRRMTAVRVEHPKAYSSWSEDEEEELSGLYRTGKPTKEISNLLGRKPGAIRSRLKKLGLVQ